MLQAAPSLSAGGKTETETGLSAAHCENETGRDTVFGGASARDRRIKVKAHIKTETGSAVIRLRMNGRATKFLPDSDGNFEREFDFGSGGNYIMVDFNRFTGTVWMTAEYV